MPVSFPIALLSPREMAEADRLAGLATPSIALMERAGAAVADVAEALIGDTPRRVLVLCGPGNNGGDGYVAARLLRDAGCDVALSAATDRAALKGDAAIAAERWDGEVHPLERAVFDGRDLVVDALFGAGLSRAIEGEAAAAVERTNAWRRASGRPVLAVDMPSGVDGADGRTAGVAIEASDTITFFRLKPGHVLMPGRALCGRLRLADIGIDAGVLEAIAPKTSLNDPELWRALLPIPTLDGHKYARGHAVVVSGPLAQTGAARLAARGALRGGAGLVTVATPAEALAVHAAALTAVMTRVVDGPASLCELLADERKNVVCLGPGLGVGEGTRDLVRAALAPRASSARSRSVVLDADALTSFGKAPADLSGLIAAAGGPVVLTPHDGEFARLFDTTTDFAAGKTTKARAAAAVSGAVIVLKGPDTVVAAADGRVSIAMSDAPWLATAGSGDVLAGIITGLLAQGMPVWEAASAAVWMHADAARRFGPGLISEDIPDLLPGVWRELTLLPADHIGDRDAALR